MGGNGWGDIYVAVGLGVPLLEVNKCAVGVTLLVATWPVPERGGVASDFAVRGFLFILSRFSGLFLVHLGVRARDIIVAAGADGGREYSVGSRTGMLCLSCGSDPNRLSTFPLACYDVVGYNGIDEKVTIGVKVPAHSAHAFRRFFGK